MIAPKGISQESIEKWTEIYQALVDGGKINPSLVSLGTFVQEQYSKQLLSAKSDRTKKKKGV